MLRVLERTPLCVSPDSVQPPAPRGPAASVSVASGLPWKAAGVEEVHPCHRGPTVCLCGAPSSQQTRALQGI